VPQTKVRPAERREQPAVRKWCRNPHNSCKGLGRNSSLQRASAADGPGLVGELRESLWAPAAFSSPVKLKTLHSSVSKGKPGIFPQLKNRTKHPSA